MAQAIDWLKESQGLAELRLEEIDAIRDFTLLWGLFEGRAMATDGSQPRTVAAVERMVMPDQLPQVFTDALEYWRERYIHAEDAGHRFDALRFQPNPFRTLVVEVLSGAREGHREILQALLLIIFRLRNNLFHGVKWQYLLHDQHGNFSHANAVLMAAIEMAVPPP